MNQEKYTKAYQGLNEKQKQAVDTIYGPPASQGVATLT
jgi:hypothetical protein